MEQFANHLEKNQVFQGLQREATKAKWGYPVSKTANAFQKPPKSLPYPRTIGWRRESDDDLARHPTIGRGTCLDSIWILSHVRNESKWKKLLIWQRQKRQSQKCHLHREHCWQTHGSSGGLKSQNIRAAPKGCRQNLNTDNI